MKRTPRSCCELASNKFICKCHRTSLTSLITFLIVSDWGRIVPFDIPFIEHLSNSIGVALHFFFFFFSKTSPSSYLTTGKGPRVWKKPQTVFSAYIYMDLLFIPGLRLNQIRPKKKKEKQRIAVDFASLIRIPSLALVMNRMLGRLSGFQGKKIGGWGPCGFVRENN